jgi:hypothetical protein
MKIATSVIYSYVRGGWSGFDYANEYGGITKACNEIL